MRSEEVHQDFIQLGFENLHDGEMHNLPGQLFQCLTVLMGKEFFLRARLNLVCFHLLPLCLVLLPYSTVQSSAPSSSWSCRYWQADTWSPWNCLFWMNMPHSISVSSEGMCSSSLTTPEVIQLALRHFVHWGFNCPCIWSNDCCIKGDHYYPWNSLKSYAFANTATFAARTHCWFMFSCYLPKPYQ